MAKKIGHIALISVLLISVFHGTYAETISEWVNSFTANLNKNIHDMVEEINHQVSSEIDTVNQSVQSALEEARRAVDNLPKDKYGRVIPSSFGTFGNTVIINNGHGQSKTITSGYTKDNEPYVRQVEERNDGNVFYHYESYFNPKNNTVQKTCWKLDYSKPGATPETLKDCDSNA